MIISKEEYKSVTREFQGDTTIGIFRILEITQKYSSVNHDNSDFLFSVDYGLNVFLRLPYFISASLYSLDEQNYEFKHYRTLPSNQREKIINVFADIVESGIVGTSIESNYFAVFSKEADASHKENKSHYLVFPLTTSESTFGLLIFETIESPHRIEHNAMELIEIIKNIFKMKLVNCLLLINEKTQTDINQLASEKAVSLNNS